MRVTRGSRPNPLCKILNTPPGRLFVKIKRIVARVENYNHGQKSWDTCVSEAFSNSHTSNRSPHPINNVGRVYPESFPSFNFV